MVALLDDLRTPLPAWSARATLESDPRLHGVLHDVDEAVVRPLEGARDEVEWTSRLDAVLPTWRHLRSAFVGMLLQTAGARAVVQAIEDGSLSDVDVALPEPGKGAASYAALVLRWIARGPIGFARRRTLDVERLAALVDQVAGLELALLTVRSPREVAPPVRDTAAWEAYARARAILSAACEAGIDLRGLPLESPVDRAARARVLLERVASCWTPEARDAVGAARFSRAPELP